MYKKILVPVVFDDDHDTSASIAVAKTLADPGAAFTVMHVLDVIPSYAAYQVPAELLEEAREATERHLNKQAEALPGAKTALTAGHAGRQIVNHAHAQGLTASSSRPMCRGLRISFWALRRIGWYGMQNARCM